MMEQPAFIIQSEQQGPHGFLALIVTEAADDAVCRSEVFNFLHAQAIARLIGQVPTLGDDAVETRTDLSQPFPGFGRPCGCGR